MRYKIFESTAPAMPKPGKGTEFIKLMLSQASKEMKTVLVPMAMPALATRLAGVKVMYSDNKYYEMCGQMGHLIGPSGIGKAQLTHLVEAIMRQARTHDHLEFQRLEDWQRQTKTKGANKDKPERPELTFWFPPANLTNAAFLQNAMALEKQGERTQYLNLPEVEMADNMFGGHRQVSQMVRNIYDCQRAGALRATADGVSGNPRMRVNITFTSTPDAARAFYKKDLMNGFFGRIPFAYIARGERSGKIPRQGSYSEDFLPTGRFSKKGHRTTARTLKDGRMQQPSTRNIKPLTAEGLYHPPPNYQKLPNPPRTASNLPYPPTAIFSRCTFAM